MSKKVNGKYYTEKQAAYVKKYEEKFEKLYIRLPKGEKDELKEKVKEYGYKSLSSFINESILLNLDRLEKKERRKDKNGRP